MKISPVNFTSYKIYNHSAKRNDSKEIKQFAQFPKADYRPAFLGKNSYGEYKPVSLKKPNYDLLNCNYSNIDKFSNLFAQKINSQLRAVNLPDIQALCKRIQMKTKADPKLINEVLYQLTVLSGYCTIDYFQGLADKYNTNLFGIQQDIDYQLSDISSNIALSYLAKNKKMINKPTDYYSKSLIVLDGIFLKELEYSKKNHSDFYKKFIRDLRNHDIKLLNIKGWDVECSDGTYRSAAFLYGTGQLEDLAVDTIKRIQNGENLDDILWKNSEDKLREIIGQDLRTDQIDIEREVPELKDNVTQTDILRNIQIPAIEADDVRQAILKTLGRTDDFIPYIKKDIALLSKYLDEFSVAYSFDSMAIDLIELKRKIEEKYGKNILYLMTLPHKSGGLVAHLYAKINNIEPEMFYDDKNQPFLHTQAKRETNYPTVVLDDISASGKTIERETFNKAWMKYAALSPYSFGLLAVTNMAQSVFDCDKFKTGELICSNKVNDLYLYEGSSFSKEDINKIKKMVSQGYNNTGCSVVFPYIIPDNCTDLTAHAFRKLLIKDNDKTNKVLSNAKHLLGA